VSIGAVRRTRFLDRHHSANCSQHKIYIGCRNDRGVFDPQANYRPRITRLLLIDTLLAGSYSGFFLPRFAILSCLLLSNRSW
jgi:hypothetical protein